MADITHLTDKIYEKKMQELADGMHNILHEEPPGQAVVRIVEAVDTMLQGKRAEEVIVGSMEERRKRLQCGREEE